MEIFEILDALDDILRNLNVAQTMNDELWATLFSSDTPCVIEYTYRYDRAVTFSNVEGEYMYETKKLIEDLRKSLEEGKKHAE